MCPLGIFLLIRSSLDPTFNVIFICDPLHLMFSKLDWFGSHVETNTMSTLRITMVGRVRNCAFLVANATKTSFLATRIS